MKAGEFESGIRKLAIQFKPLIELGDMLNSIGTFERHESEVQSKLLRAKKELDEVELAKQSTYERISEKEKHAVDIVHTSEAKAKAIIESAEYEAKKLHSEIVKEAEAAAKKIISESEKFKTLLDSNKSKSDELDKKIQAKQKDLDGISSKIAEARENAKKLLGL